VILVPVVYKEPYLLVYCESALEVYDVISTKWIQTIPFRKVSQRYTKLLGYLMKLLLDLMTFLSHIVFS